jgi:hypothetical protein
MSPTVTDVTRPSHRSFRSCGCDRGVHFLGHRNEVVLRPLKSSSTGGSKCRCQDLLPTHRSIAEGLTTYGTILTRPLVAEMLLLPHHAARPAVKIYVVMNVLTIQIRGAGTSDSRYLASGSSRRKPTKLSISVRTQHLCTINQTDGA